MNALGEWVAAVCIAAALVGGCGKSRQALPSSDANVVEDREPDAGMSKDAGKQPATDASIKPDQDAGRKPFDAAMSMDPHDAASVPDADVCQCLGLLNWRLSDIAPCLFRASDGKTFLYSSKLTDNGRLDCGSAGPDASTPPMVPSPEWSESAFTADCAGSYRLCIEIKVGDVAMPKADDCVVVSLCQEVSYLEANVEQQLPPLPSWVAESACTAQFDQRGGYADMTISGRANDCGSLDGSVEPFVFARTSYCPPSCVSTPDTPECAACAVGTR